MKKLFITLIILPVFLLLTSCVEGEVKPQDPLWEREGCARCRMVISEKRFAVQRILSGGQVYYYDDINCALKHGHASADGKLFVRPEGGSDWVPAESVSYESGLRTPMNSGYGAVNSGGTVSFEEIQKKFREE